MSCRSSRVVVLFTRSGCHLCEDAGALLARLAPEYGLTITEKDIESDRELLRRYHLVIPVVQLESGQELQAPITEPQLRAALEAGMRTGD